MTNFAAALSEIAQLQQSGQLPRSALIGSVAAIARGVESFYTQDLDLTVLTNYDDLHNLMDSLKQQYPTSGQSMFTVIIQGVPVQLFPSDTGPTYAAALEAAEPVLFEGQTINVPPVEYLIILALDAAATQEDKYRYRISQLLPLANRSKLESLINQFNPSWMNIINKTGSRPDASGWTEVAQVVYAENQKKHDIAGAKSFEEKLAILDSFSFNIRLGASTQERAEEVIQDILGFGVATGQGMLRGDTDPKDGYKPPRADIAKMFEIDNLFEKARYRTDAEGLDISDLEAQKEFKSKYSLTRDEQRIVWAYVDYLGDITDPFEGWDEERAFAKTVEWAENEPELRLNPGQAKAAVGHALKKYEQQNSPLLFRAIKKALDDCYRRNIESHKLWPRMVSWIKDEFQKQLKGGNLQNQVGMEPNRIPALEHIIDIVTEGGPILDQLRRENQMPTNMDVNKMEFYEFENWLMGWKAENRESEAKGEVLYEWPDGYTIQRLTTEEQLQFEGDEMGHCVGGYHHSVASGEDLIYSLRDKKGTPHVTIQIQGGTGFVPIGDKPIKEWDAETLADFGSYSQQAGSHTTMPLLETKEDQEHYQKLVNEQRKDLVDQFYPSYAVRPQKDLAPESPAEEWENVWEYEGRKHNRLFEVVQIMGNSNKTPQSQYQAKVKEWLTSLRDEKGVNFRRGNSWTAPYDQPYGDDDVSVGGARELEEWYDEDYTGNPDRYKGTSEDEYGMATNPVYFSANWETIMEEALIGLVDDYDRSNWKTRDWAGLAKAVFHAWMLEAHSLAWTRRRDPEALKKDYQSMIEDADMKVWDWANDSNYYFLEGMEDEIRAKYQELGGEFEEDGYTMSDDELEMEARDAIVEEADDQMYGACYKFLGYLHNLGEHVGIVEPSGLPDPRDRNGGLPDYESLIELNEQAIQKSRDQWQEGQLEIPGAIG